MSTILINGTKTAALAPTVLQDRELYINQTDEKLFYKNTGGIIKAFDLISGGGASTFKQTDETAAVAMPYVKKLRRTLYFGDRKDNITGNGTSDDTAAAQDDITYASAQGLQLLIPDGMKIRTTATLLCRGWTRIKGRGGHLTKNNGNPNALGNYTGFVFDHRAIGLNCSSVDTNNFDRADLEDFIIVRPQPAATGGAAWTPNADDFDINMNNAQGNIIGVECLRSTNFIRVTGGIGKVFIDRVQGQVFNVGVQVQAALDNVYLRQAHFWPFWTGGYGITDAVPVLTYMLSSHLGVHALRADGLVIGDLFTFAARSSLMIDRYDGGGNTGLAGTLNNGSFNKIYNDNGVSAVTVQPGATGFVFRGNMIESYGVGAPFYTGGANGIDINATSCLLNVRSYWGNNHRNSHAAVTALNGHLRIGDFMEGGWNSGAGTSASLVTTNGGLIDVTAWRKADAITAAFTNAPINGLRYAGKVKGPLSDGLTAITTDANGQASWNHNAGQQPVTAKVVIYNPGGGNAATFARTELDATKIYGTFYTPAGAIVASRTDIVVDWQTATTYQPN